MTITIELSPAEEEKLAHEAGRAGQPPGEYAKAVLVRHLRPRRSLDEILAPFREQVEQSGMTDDELDTLFEEARDEVFRLKQTPVR